MAKTVFDVLKTNSRVINPLHRNFLGTGGAKDFSQYKEVVGLIRGLEAGINYVEDLAKNYMENDDD